MTLKHEYSIQEIADKYVAIAKNRETRTVEHVFNLNGTGALILKALQDGKDIPAIISQLMSEYDVRQEEAEKGVNAFVSMLIKKGLAQH